MSFGERNKVKSISPPLSHDGPILECDGKHSVTSLCPLTPNPLHHSDCVRELGRAVTDSRAAGRQVRSDERRELIARSHSAGRELHELCAEGVAGEAVVEERRGLGSVDFEDFDSQALCEDLPNLQSVIDFYAATTRETRWRL